MGCLGGLRPTNDGLAVDLFLEHAGGILGLGGGLLRAHRLRAHFGGLGIDRHLLGELARAVEFLRLHGLAGAGELADGELQFAGGAVAGAAGAGALDGRFGDGELRRRCRCAGTAGEGDEGDRRGGQCRRCGAPERRIQSVHGGPWAESRNGQSPPPPR
jgi:hypothetical protein